MEDKQDSNRDEDGEELAAGARRRTLQHAAAHRQVGSSCQGWEHTGDQDKDRDDQGVRATPADADRWSLQGRETGTVQELGVAEDGWNCASNDLGWVPGQNLDYVPSYRDRDRRGGSSKAGSAIVRDEAHKSLNEPGASVVYLHDSREASVQIEWSSPSGEAEPVDVAVSGSRQYLLEQRVRPSSRGRAAPCRLIQRSAYLEVPHLVAELICTSSSRTDGDRVKWMGAWSGAARAPS
ncbi:Serine--tRNA ligase, partial [Frankliniella fusca]